MRLTEVQLASTTVLLFLAGHETTVNPIANGVLTLLRHPDELSRLRGNPGLLPRAVKELLRYEPPVDPGARRPDARGISMPPRRICEVR
ncbi:hypothetical protein CG723_22955 [Streptomyces sp. CB01635]|uniref:hypothetical protein n=1 Tax=unclassified Streptomyces TaxID=2593676 RepID=UPI000C27224B|nr:hypothetical protein [Streptomyces sp. CB01635]PJN09594.1 hypothetical protein CG723_22955 [Streptomyces sp. CB01635]